MYRTDKQFMKNPATAPSRIYVGNLAETVIPDSLEEKFSPHGTILGLVLQRGFGFIQFETESQAHSAINNEHATQFHGRKLNVKQAIDNAKGKVSMQPNFSMHSNQNINPHQNPHQNQHQNPHQNQHQSPHQNQNQNQHQNAHQNQHQNNMPSAQRNPPPPVKEDPVKPVNESPQKPPAPEQPKNVPPHQQNPPPHQQNPPPHQQTPTQKPMTQPTPSSIPPLMQKLSQPPPQQPKHDTMPPKHDLMPQKPLDDGPPDKKKLRAKARPLKRDYRDDYRDDMPPYYEPVPQYNSAYHAPIIDRPERNDCEIIVVSKALTEYAEYIEQRLKTLGLIVDLLFPNEDVPIGRVLANISSRGCLYAILVMPQNEEHRSLTLNVLHGIPEEHRNMPIEDAFLLITRNFEAYMRGEKFSAGGPETGKMMLTQRHPEHIQVMMNLLAENRQINTGQYDKLIDYLQEKRDLQSTFEVAEGIESGVEPEGKSKQAELQSRIMNILNKKGDDVPPKGVEPVKTATPTPLLNDPSVQKALDSLLLGDMFKGLTS